MTLVKQLKMRKTFFPQASQKILDFFVDLRKTDCSKFTCTLRQNSFTKQKRKKENESVSYIYKEALESELLEKEYKKAARAFCFVISDSFL